MAVWVESPPSILLHLHLLYVPRSWDQGRMTSIWLGGVSGSSGEGPLTHFQEGVLTIYKPRCEDPWEAGPGQLLKMAAVWLEDTVLYSTRLGGTDLQSEYMKGGGRRLRSSGSLRPSWAPWDQASQTTGGRRGLGRDRSEAVLESGN